MLGRQTRRDHNLTLLDVFGQVLWRTSRLASACIPLTPMLRILDWVPTRSSRTCSANTLQDVRRFILGRGNPMLSQECVPRSITAYVLLRLGGVAAEMRVGVGVAPFRAHSWVVVPDDTIFLDDGNEIDSYSVISGTHLQHRHGL